MGSLNLNLVYVLLTLLLLTLTHGSPTGLEEDLEEDDDSQQMGKFRKDILKELGFKEVENIPQEKRSDTHINPQVNITKEEYKSAYAKYMRNVRLRKGESWNNMKHMGGRRKAVIKIQDYYDKGTSYNHKTTFHFSIKLMEDKDEMHVRVRRAELWLPKGCTLPTNSTKKREEEGEELVVYDLTQEVISWLFNANKTSPYLELFADCSLPHPEARLKVVRSEALLRRGRRSNPNKTSLQTFKSSSKMAGRECTKTRRGKTCCRRSLKVNFSDLGISDVIIEPHEFDAHVCVGRCNAKRLAFASTHAMFQHILHQSKGKKFTPRPCCAPTKLAELDVIHLDPSGTKLEVTVLKDAIVTECGCS